MPSIQDLSPSKTAVGENPNPEDLLVPPYDSQERKSTTLVATFNLVATIVGGGVLSLPLAFEKCGIVLAIVFMVFAAVITDRSLQMLCISARRTGATSYGEVARTAFGEWLEWFVSLLLFIFLLFVLTAYFVLIQDIWTPLFSMLFGVSVRSEVVLLGVLVLLSPFLVQRTLHALRWNCYIGFASVSILCIALCRHAINNPLPAEGGNESTGRDIRYAVVPNLTDVLFAFPIVMLSFLCHFNVVSVQEALIRPSRKRTERVINTAVFVSFLLMTSLGLGGYVYAGPKTEGNILLNVTDDWGFLLGRLGCGITIVLATPLMLLPCRESILELIDVWFHNDEEVIERHSPILDSSGSPVGERTSLVRHDPIQKDRVFRNPILHYASTLIIVVACFTAAVAVSGVAVVWSLCGSSMAFLVAFVLPSLCFIRIESQAPIRLRSTWLYFAWALLLFAVIGAIVCTTNTISTM